LEQTLFFRHEFHHFTLMFIRKLYWLIGTRVQANGCRVKYALISVSCQWIA